MYKKIAVIQNRITAMHFTHYIYHKKTHNHSQIYGLAYEYIKYNH